MIKTLLLSEPTVLIVDDQLTSRKILAQVIRNINPNAVIIEKDCAKKALDWALNNDANLVLSDHLLNDSIGTDLIKTLRGMPNYDSVPIMMITIKDDVQTRKDAFDAGVSAFVTKPVVVKDFSARVKKMLPAGI